MRRPLCIVCLLFCLLWGVIGTHFVTMPYPLPEGEQVLLQGRIYWDEGEENPCLYLTDISQIQSESLQISFPTNIKIYFSKPQEYQVGETIRVKGEVQYFQEKTNPGQFDQRRYQNIRDVGFVLKNAAITGHGQTYRWIDQALWRLRNRWAFVYKRYCGRQYGTMRSIFLGVKDEMEPELKELYQRAGISHILAISGLHISFLGLLLYSVLKRIRMPEKMSFLMTSLFLILYGRMTGMSSSAMRAVIMLILLLFGQLLGRSYDMLTAMAVSLFLVLLKNPRLMNDTGFQLSYACVLAIGLEVPQFFERVSGICAKRTQIETTEMDGHRIRKYLKHLSEKTVQSFWFSFGITLFTLPILLNSYYSFSPYSVFLNLIVIPLMSLVLLLGFIGGILGMLLPFLASLFLTPTVWILEFYEVLCSMVRDLPKSSWIIGKPALWQMILYYLVLVGMLMTWKYARRKTGKAETSGKECRQRKCLKILSVLAFSASLLFILILPVRLKNYVKTEITMLDIGQGDCFCLQLNGKVFLMDGGSSSEGEIAKYKIEPFLKSQGISRINACFISHSDEDHTNGIAGILARKDQSGICCDCLVLSSYAKEHKEEYEELVTAAEKAECAVSYLEAGESVVKKSTAGENEFRILCLAPRGESFYADANDSSMVLLLECAGNTMLFTGDISEEQETAILASLQRYAPHMWKDIREKGGIDVLKIAHHGSRSSTSLEFLNALSPQIAVISAGRRNRYGHPHEETLNRLQAAGCRIFRTDTEGAVVIRLGNKDRNAVIIRNETGGSGTGRL
ncbi:MAG: DNA internalization-related competence protein ComEC/Rec2 [Lachnospiraceae bacterium]|nr:DNA internalization-related competence protein ComEC/Rec2 [Lachnospiraceae bacterium]